MKLGSCNSIPTLHIRDLRGERENISVHTEGVRHGQTKSLSGHTQSNVFSGGYSSQLPIECYKMCAGLQVLESLSGGPRPAARSPRRCPFRPSLHTRVPLSL